MAAYTNAKQSIPQCFLDKIEIDKKVDDFMKRGIIAWTDLPEWRKLRNLQETYRSRCALFIKLALGGEPNRGNSA